MLTSRTRTRIHVDIKGSLDVRNLAGNCRAAACPAVRGRGWRVLCVHRDGGRLAGTEPAAAAVRGGDLRGSAHLKLDECGAGAGSGRQAADSGRRRTGSQHPRSWPRPDRRVTGGLSRDRPTWRPVRRSRVERGQRAATRRTRIRPKHTARAGTMDHNGGPSAARPSWSAAQQPHRMPPIQWAERRQRCRVGPTEPSRIAAEKA